MNEFKHFGETIRIRGGNIDSVECSDDIPGIIVNVTPETNRFVTGITGMGYDPWEPISFATTYWPPSKKEKHKFEIKKIQRNPKKNATTVIFENGHVEVVKRNELDPETDLYSVVAYAVAKYVYGSNSAFKRQIRDCIFESLEVK